MKPVRDYIERAMTFAEYTKLINDLLIDGKTTGPVQSPEMYNYTKLNRQRTARLEKALELAEDAVSAIAGLNVEWIWLVITEGWCGDAAQNIPMIEKIAAQNPGIQTRYILRDDNPELTDQHLTNGARSIPLLISIDASSFEVLGTWGPRPKAGQEYFLKLRSHGASQAEINEKIQRWYNEDDGRSLQAEFVDLTSAWTTKGLTKVVTAEK